MSKPILTQEYLAKLFRYDDGKLIWLDNVCRVKVKDKVAGTLGTNGYRTVTIAKHKYLAHRLVWILLKGTEPIFIDHINQNKLDNRIENLRSVEILQNRQNLKAHKNNTIGFGGINKVANKYIATLSYKNNKQTLGSFDTLEEAISMRLTAMDSFGFSPNHGTI